MGILNNLKIIENDSKVILINNNNGKWIKISYEVYKILLDLEKRNISINDFENEDRIFLKNIIKETNNIRKNDIEKFIGYEITDKCNLLCKHCCFSYGLNDKVIDLEKIYKILDKILEFNPDVIQISGGEPMMLDNIEAYLKYLKDRGHCKIILSTNGTLFNDNNIKIITKLVDQIDISIDGYDEVSCSKIRGKGVFSKVINNIKKIKSADFEKITVSMVFSEKNYNEQAKFIEFCKDINVYPQTRYFSESGRGKENIELFKINKDIFFIPEDFFEKKWYELNARKCLAGKSEFFIKENGDVYPCPQFTEEEFLLGNILQNDLESMKIKKQIDVNEKFLDDCKDCKVEPFCWTCPGSKKEIKNKYMKDNMCNKIYSHLYKEIWED